jgi:hypothetical protein
VPVSKPHGFPSQAMMEVVISQGEAEKNYWRDLWRYRELF